MIAILSHPEALAILALGLKLLYAGASRVARPYPRARAVVEALTALMPDLVRFVEKALEAGSGRRGPTLDSRGQDPEKKALMDRLEAAERVIEAMRETGK